MATSIEDIQREITSYGSLEPEYYQKMMHKIPSGKVVEREPFILSLCKDKSVLNVGSASGQLHEAIRGIAKKLYGIDKDQPTDYVVDLDQIQQLWDMPHITDIDLIVCGEVLEHLSNPGNFLAHLAYRC
jgi:2-polyprenyl-3-methyl-5-hydroxy-6-metoxy-1,4-benzoquinol methylase